MGVTLAEGHVVSMKIRRKDKIGIPIYAIWDAWDRLVDFTNSLYQAKRRGSRYSQVGVQNVLPTTPQGAENIHSREEY